jgi:hemolysin activation/secretion protein
MTPCATSANSKKNVKFVKIHLWGPIQNSLNRYFERSMAHPSSIHVPKGPARSLCPSRLGLSCLILLGLLGPATSEASTPDNPLESICKSSLASLQALKEDPLLSTFFQSTCGKTLDEAIGQSTPIAQAEAAPTLSRDDNRPRLNSPEPAAPRLEIAPSIGQSPRTVEPRVIPQGEAGVVIREIGLRGVSIQTSSGLNSLLKPYIGAPMAMESLDQLTQTIHAWYRTQGWLARAALPSQDLSDGRVLVEVVESIFGGAEILDPQGALRNTQVPQKLVEVHQKKDTPINLRHLEQASAALRDLSGVESNIQLKPGAAEGTTEAVVAVTPKAAIETQVNLDNLGSKATGEERLNASLRFNNLTHRGDTLTTQALTSKGLDYFRVGYDLPFTAGGWRFTSHLAHSEYELVSQEFETLGMKGPAQNAGLGLLVPLLRDSRDNVTLRLGIDQNRFKNEAVGSVISRYQSDVLGLQLDGQHSDGLGAGGQSQWAIEVSRGELDLSDSPVSHQQGDAASARTAGYFSKAKASMNRRQWLTPSHSILVNLQGQWADKNLDGSEKFFLGGARGVRAYPTSEAPGSAGYLFSLEYETRLMATTRSRWSLATFYDRGEIERYKNVFASSLRNRYALEGYGIWLGHQSRIGAGQVGFKVTVARRMGSNPEANVRGEDQDGTRIKNRVWFDANLQF